jgi:CheY-like chemotaxis protein
VPADPHELISHAVASASDDASHPIIVDTSDPLPLVRADAARIQQVLANLLSNARKYSPEPGEIHVRARLIDGAIEIAVQDQGLGIPADALPRLFQKFYRVDNSDRRNITGTGLGLAICRQIIAAHGGRIWAESAGVGQGARFTFTLPLAESSQSHGDVLVIENNAGFARLLEAELASLGLTGTIVDSAEAGLKQLAAGPPRAVLLDLLLPGIQGETFLTRMRERGLRDVPVVVVTIKELRAPQRAALERDGVVALVRKGPGASAAAAAAAARAIQERETGTHREAV